MQNFLIVAVGFFFSHFLIADDVFYCTEELSTGFKYKNDSFSETIFVKERFTLMVHGDAGKIGTADGIKISTANGTWKDAPCKLGFMSSVYICTDRFNLGMTFNFNKDNNRFLETYTGIYGYLSHKSQDLSRSERGEDILTAGKCVQF
jgi:hypothetical protein